MKRKILLLLVSGLMILQAGCGESLILEDATEAPADSSAAAVPTESQTDSDNPMNAWGQISEGASAIIGNARSSKDESDDKAKEEKGNSYTDNFVTSKNKEVMNLIPYDPQYIDSDNDEVKDKIQLRINEDSMDHTLSGLRFLVNGTINDFPYDTSDYDTFRGAYICDFNYTDDLSNIITVFTSSKTGKHLTTLYSLRHDKISEIDSFGGFIDLLSIDGAGEFSITEATNIKTSKYGTMYVRKYIRTGQTYNSSTEEYQQELLVDSNTVGYYPEEGHFAVGYPFSLKKEMTLYVDSDEDYTTGTLPVNFRGVMKEMLLKDDLNPKVLLVEPEDGWNESETNIDSPIYAPSAAGSDDFDPDEFTGWISFTELSQASAEDFESGT